MNMPYKDPYDRREYVRQYRAKKGRTRDSESNKTKLQKRARHLQREYGMTLADYDMWYAAQGGGCAICGVLECPSQREYLSVDHNHDTGMVRGLLCHNCNLLLGYANDDVARLARAIEYLAEREGD